MLQSGGTITLRQVSNEFGGSDPISMSEYYRGGAYVPSSLFFTSGYSYQTSAPQYYWQDSYWGFTRQVWYAGTLITNNAGYNVTTITSGSQTYYRGTFQTNQGQYFSGGFQFYVNYYYYSIATGSNQLVNSNIPTGGLIRMSNFYSGRKT